MTCGDNISKMHQIDHTDGDVLHSQSLSHCVLQPFSDVYPHLRTATDVPVLVKIADVNWDEVDAAFCCLPHATTQETLAQLPKHIKVVDLSADFRLRNVDTYAEW